MQNSVVREMLNFQRVLIRQWTMINKQNFATKQKRGKSSLTFYFFYTNKYLDYYKKKNWLN